MQVFDTEHRILSMYHRVAIRAKWNKILNRIYLVAPSGIGELLLAMMNVNEILPEFAVDRFEIERACFAYRAVVLNTFLPRFWIALDPLN